MKYDVSCSGETVSALAQQALQRALLCSREGTLSRIQRGADGTERVIRALHRPHVLTALGSELQDRIWMVESAGLPSSEESRVLERWSAVFVEAIQVYLQKTSLHLPELPDPEGRSPRHYVGLISLWCEQQGLASSKFRVDITGDDFLLDVPGRRLVGFRSDANSAPVLPLYPSEVTVLVELKRSSEPLTQAELRGLEGCKNHRVIPKLRERFEEMFGQAIFEDVPGGGLRIAVTMRVHSTS